MNRTFHLIETELLPPGEDLARSETSAGVGLEQVLGDGTGASRLSGLLFFIVDGGILRLEVLDEGIDVLIFLLLFCCCRVDLGGDTGLLLAGILPLFLLRDTWLATAVGRRDAP